MCAEDPNPYQPPRPQDEQADSPDVGRVPTKGLLVLRAASAGHALQTGWVFLNGPWDAGILCVVNTVVLLTWNLIASFGLRANWLGYLATLLQFSCGYTMILAGSDLALVRTSTVLLVTGYLAGTWQLGRSHVER